MVPLMGLEAVAKPLSIINQPQGKFKATPTIRLRLHKPLEEATTSTFRSSTTTHGDHHWS
ncbi:hypothetical protein H5410_022561 [Solanum commersonii]|uniref:Uncharacterized protein n=1 Tax=Solanum commersonii TaxID=4109 RepID=A0A9J5ZHJ3_SOLCO|nr:hypothetical protein H5410_022561 [Solanum commersonii]